MTLEQFPRLREKLPCYVFPIFALAESIVVNHLGKGSIPMCEYKNNVFCCGVLDRPLNDVVPLNICFFSICLLYLHLFSVFLNKHKLVRITYHN